MAVDEQIAKQLSYQMQKPVRKPMCFPAGLGLSSTSLDGERSSL